MRQVVDLDSVESEYFGEHLFNVSESSQLALFSRSIRLEGIEEKLLKSLFL